MSRSAITASLLLLSLVATITAVAKEKPTILALSPHVVEQLFAIGAGDQIIATTEFADYPEKAKSIPRIGNYARLQIERVVELQPDVIIAWKTGNPADDLLRLESLGFRIVYSDPKSLKDVANEMLQFGQITGNTEKAEFAAKAYQNKLESIKKRYESKPELTVFYELWSRPLSTIAKGSWPQLLLDVCKANNPFVKAVNSYPQVGIEQVLVHDIELIVQPLSENQKDKEGFNWHKWKSLKAVKNSQIIQPDADQLHRMTPRVLDELEVLCEQIDASRNYYLSKS